MRPITYYIDKCITAVYIAALIGGVLVCTTTDTSAASENKKIVNIRCVASVNDSDYMTADDFLFDNESAADKKGITEYIEKLERDGLPKENEADASSDENTDESANESEETADDEAILDDVPGDGDTDMPIIDPDDWRLMLVNKQNPVPEGFEPQLANINESQRADERIISDIYRMIDAAEEDGINLMICSAYRSYDRQQKLFDNKINKLMREGYTYLEAYKIGSMNVTVPGTSEHHIGLALDILTGSYTTMDDGFGDTDAGKWLAGHAPEYGFILRYPRGKEEITGIVYEPWHFRYVGREYAMDITERGVCLEEYLKGEY